MHHDLTLAPINSSATIRKSSSLDAQKFA